MIKIIKFENDCVGCPQGCGHCGANRTPYFYCDVCKDDFEPNELADYNGMMICKDCLFNEFLHYTYDDAERDEGGYDY